MFEGIIFKIVYGTEELIQEFEKEFAEWERSKGIQLSNV